MRNPISLESFVTFWVVAVFAVGALFVGHLALRESCGVDVAAWSKAHRSTFTVFVGTVLDRISEADKYRAEGPGDRGITGRS